MRRDLTTRSIILEMRDILTIHETILMNNIPEWDEHKYKTLWSVILGHVSENISVSGDICS